MENNHCHSNDVYDVGSNSRRTGNSFRDTSYYPHCTTNCNWYIYICVCVYHILTFYIWVLTKILTLRYDVKLSDYDYLYVYNCSVTLDTGSISSCWQDQYLLIDRINIFLLTGSISFCWHDQYLLVDRINIFLLTWSISSCWQDQYHFVDMINIFLLTWLISSCWQDQYLLVDMINIFLLTGSISSCGQDQYLLVDRINIFLLTCQKPFTYNYLIPKETYLYLPKSFIGFLVHCLPWLDINELQYLK